MVTTPDRLGMGDEALVEGDRARLLRRAIIHLESHGHTRVRARVPSFTAPAVLTGTLADCRPDITAAKAGGPGLFVFVEVVIHEVLDLEDEALERRWCLLASAAKLYNAELHFVIDQEEPALSARLRRRLQFMSIHPASIWAI